MIALEIIQIIKIHYNSLNKFTKKKFILKKHKNKEN